MAVIKIKRGSLDDIDSLFSSPYVDGTIYVSNGAYPVWHSGNDGFGSGLDADTVDGKHSSNFLSSSALSSHADDFGLHNAGQYNEYVNRDSNGNITSYQIKSGSTVLYTKTISRSSNTITGFTETYNGETITSTINRDSSNNITSITKSVS